MGYTYGVHSRLTQLSDSVGTADYVYNPRGLMSRVDVDGPPPAFQFAYDAVGRLQTTTNEIGVTDTRVFDDAGQLLSVTSAVGTAGPLSRAAYTLNTAGLRTSVIREDATADGFAYDNARQVVRSALNSTYNPPSTVVPGIPDRRYVYDAMGNRTSAVTDGTTTAYTPNPTNGYSAVGGATWSYDLNGNQTGDGAKTFAWEIHDRLATVTAGGVVQGAYAYDAFGRRIARQWRDTGGTVRLVRYVYDGWNVTAEHTATLSPTATTLALTRRYVWGNDLSGTRQGAGGVGGLLLIEDRTAGTPVSYYPHYDGNGNLVKLTTQGTGGAVITAASYTYDPFGNLRTATGPYAAANPVRFSTKFQDAETGWSYYGYRYYDAVNGRWPSRDKMSEIGGWNLYAFVFNDSCNYQDVLGYAPHGNQRQDEFKDWTPQDLKDTYDDLGKGRRSSEEKALRQRIKKEQKARRLRHSRQEKECPLPSGAPAPLPGPPAIPTGPNPVPYTPPTDPRPLYTPPTGEPVPDTNPPPFIVPPPYPPRERSFCETHPVICIGGAVVGAVVIIGVTIAEDVATLGAGIADDNPSVGAAGALVAGAWNAAR